MADMLSLMCQKGCGGGIVERCCSLHSGPIHIIDGW